MVVGFLLFFFSFPPEIVPFPFRLNFEQGCKHVLGVCVRAELFGV